MVSLAKPCAVCLVAFLAAACASSPAAPDDAAEDGGGDADAGGAGDAGFAPWPPHPGDAGLAVLWTVNGAPPTQAACLAVGFGGARVLLVNPKIDIDTWTAASLAAPCAAGGARLDPSAGVLPGRYRFRVELERADGGLFPEEPGGVATLVAGEAATLATMDITAAAPADAGN